MVGLVLASVFCKSTNTIGLERIFSNLILIVFRIADFGNVNICTYYNFVCVIKHSTCVESDKL